MPDDLKTCLLGEIKQEKWRKSINDKEYAQNTSLVQEICQKNLAAVTKMNKNFKHTKYRRNSSVCRKIDANAREAYSKWRELNVTKIQCPEVSAENLMFLVHYLNSEPHKNDKNVIQNCLKRQNSEFEVFWDSPSYILQAVRKCVLTRDWDSMTYFLLILLNYDKKYLHIIKKMCKLMLKFNPLVKECGLEDQFNTFLQKSEEQLTVV